MTDDNMRIYPKGTVETRYLDDGNARDLEETVRCLHDSCPPTDVIVLEFFDVGELMKCWYVSGSSGDVMPSDLFYANTVPLPNCTVKLKMKKPDGNGNLINDAYTVNAHFMLRETGVEELASQEHGDSVRVMTVQFYMEQNGISAGYTPCILCVDGDGRVVVSVLNADMDGPMMDLVCQLMWAWYSVQILLLHPHLRYLFKHPRMEPVYSNLDRDGKPTRTLRKVGSEKTHEIHQYDIDREVGKAEAQRRSKGDVNWKCPLWWVRGHWRNNPGKRVFIKGYWKGAMRDVQRVLDEGRERVVGRLA